MANEVFISYSRKDFEKVREIKKEIDNEIGLNCWMDLDGIESGKWFKEVIISAINRHETLLFMLTANSMQSPWSLKELQFAERKKKRVILVQIDDSEMTDEFAFDYGAKDNIIWSNEFDHDKLLSNLRLWHKHPQKKEEAPKEEGTSSQHPQTPSTEEFNEWKNVKQSADIFAVEDYITKNANGPYATEAKALFRRLRDHELANMKKRRASYDTERLFTLIKAGIFIKEDLIEEGLATEASWDRMSLDRSMFPPLSINQSKAIEAPEGCTDIYFFGTPSTGKTCLLMGLVGACGQGYFLDFARAGGKYAADLVTYVNEGITPGSTFGSFYTVINGYINEQDKGGIVKHRINFIEMSGEEFAIRIANNPNGELSFEDMGTGVTNLMMNDNRKVFFIIIDPTHLKIPSQYLEDVKNERGEIVDQIIRKVYTSQNVILSKFVSLFMQPENTKIMDKVDAIHFVVTKADTLGDSLEERKEAALNLVRKNYAQPIEHLKEYVRQQKRINNSTNYTTQLFTFSLGKFYLGDIFEFDASDAINLIDAIKHVTWGTKEKNMWDRLKDVLDG